jgi:lipoprotein-anchoring transpeptidase ErfK/SrfK
MTIAVYYGIGRQPKRTGGTGEIKTGETNMRTITAKIRYGKPELQSNGGIVDYVQPKYIYSPLLVHGDCDGKIRVPGAGTFYASQIFLHGAPQPAEGKQDVTLSLEYESPRSDVGYNCHGSFLKIIVTE